MLTRVGDGTTTSIHSVEEGGGDGVAVATFLLTVVCLIFLYLRRTIRGRAALHVPQSIAAPPSRRAQPRLTLRSDLRPRPNPPNDAISALCRSSPTSGLAASSTASTLRNAARACGLRSESSREPCESCGRLAAPALAFLSPALAVKPCKAAKRPEGAEFGVARSCS